MGDEKIREEEMLKKCKYLKKISECKKNYRKIENIYIYIYILKPTKMNM